ncbi:hypothetical protein VMCG_04519 [Cytospora schulzeri]|uniref:Calmodulin n=1 Tax=Cytospora schulzeri TaxID=448051 RepID=A0A423WSK7_9PEZI|nr:hypothetical protein VMCG_04519 [Valsa malicola]
MVSKRLSFPPKRKSGGAAQSGAPTRARQSKLAKEHDITAQEEAEIKEAFTLFAEPMDGEREGVIPIDDVRRAMIALDIPPKDKDELAEFTEILDPDDEGYATYPSFVAICALKLHARDQTSETHVSEVDEAFSLFTGTGTTGGGGGGGASQQQQQQSSVITMAHLRRVAAVLKEEVDDDLLRDMILEANGGAGVGRGVKKGDFENVMRRAGVWR